MGFYVSFKISHLKVIYSLLRFIKGSPIESIRAIVSFVPSLAHWYHESDTFTAWCGRQEPSNAEQIWINNKNLTTSLILFF